LVGATVTASWGVVSVTSTDEQHAQVIVRVRLVAVGAQQAARQTEMWRVDLANQSGWRVCSAQKDPSLNP
jgi:hypothetical protein